MPQEIDHQARAIAFHRRAQKAEGRALREMATSDRWRARWVAIVSNRSTLKKRVQKLRKQLTQAHAQNETHLERIIRMGREFS